MLLASIQQASGGGGYDPLVVANAQMASLAHVYYADDNSEGDGVSFSAITDLVGSMNGTVEGTMTIKVGANGHKYWDFSASSNAISLGGTFDPTPTSDEFTILAVVSEDKPTGATIFSKADGASSARQFQVFFSSGDIFGYVGSSSQQQTYNNPSLTPTPTYVWLTCDTVNWWMTLNGTDSSNFTPGSTTQTSDFLMGGRRASGNTGLGSDFDGGIHAMYIWNEALDNTTKQSIESDLDTQFSS